MLWLKAGEINALLGISRRRLDSQGICVVWQASRLEVGSVQHGSRPKVRVRETGTIIVLGQRGVTSRKFQHFKVWGSRRAQGISWESLIKMRWEGWKCYMDRALKVQARVLQVRWKGSHGNKLVMKGCKAEVCTIGT